jgi:hypothetical protein
MKGGSIKIAVVEGTMHDSDKAVMTWQPNGLRLHALVSEIVLFHLMSRPERGYAGN